MSLILNIYQYHILTSSLTYFSSLMYLVVVPIHLRTSIGSLLYYISFGGASLHKSILEQRNIYSYLGSKIVRNMCAPVKRESSIAFLRRPFFLLLNVTYILIRLKTYGYMMGWKNIDPR